MRCEDGPVTLVLAAAPIGDIRDASPRLAEELASADVIAAEDTRRLRRLTEDLGVWAVGRVVSYFEGNETQRIPELIDALRGGSRVLLVTDAGMPSVSDPGFRLVAAAVAEGFEVTVVPGPSAVLAALAVSGLPVDRFCFEGFLPRRRGELDTRLRSLASERRTMVFFESPRRVGKTLAAMAGVFGDTRSAVVARELTKTHEEIKRGPLAELAEWAADGLLGEVTLVVAGADRAPPAELGDGEIRLRVERAVEAGATRRDAVASIAQQTGLPRRRIYAAAHSSSETP
jgi:16S rRNA (cytidine1402-2'-O)-methyltransferase